MGVPPGLLRAARQAGEALPPRGEGVLAALAVALAVGWTTPPGLLGDASRVAAAALAVLFAATLRSRLAVGAASAVLLALASDFFTPGLPASFRARLALEGAAALLPPAAFALAAFAGRRAGLRTAARPLVWVAVALSALGASIRLGEIAMLQSTPGDASTLRYVLRYDAAFALWGAGAIALAVAFGASALARRDAHVRRRRAVAVAAVLAFLFLASDGLALVATGASPRSGLEIGYHASSAGAIPAGATLVHLEAAWPSIERSEDAFRWSRLDAKLDEAARLGVGVYLLVNTYPPDWLVEKHRDAVMVDESGEPFMWIDEAPGTPRTRVWDLSFADAEVVAAKREFVARVLDRVGEHPAVRYVAVQNEPTYPLDWNLLRWASFDPHTVAGFRDVLHAEEHGLLELLNERYGTTFASWDDVRPPALPIGEFGERWTLYRQDLLIAFVQGLVDEARAHTSKPVTVKMMAHFLTRFGEPQAGLGDRAYRAMADMSDVVSVDLYPATRADLVRSLRYFEEIADGKPVIVAEFNLALGAKGPFSGARMLAALRAMDGHADAVILFTKGDHFLYAIGEDSQVAEAVRVFELRPGDRGYGASLLGLAAGDAVALVAFPVFAARELALALGA